MRNVGPGNIGTLPMFLLRGLTWKTGDQTYLFFFIPITAAFVDLWPYAFLSKDFSHSCAQNQYQTYLENQQEFSAKLNQSQDLGQAAHFISNITTSTCITTNFNYGPKVWWNQAHAIQPASLTADQVLCTASNLWLWWHVKCLPLMGKIT